MLNIIPKQKNSYRTFQHGEDVFHRALKSVIEKGEKSFHVKNPEGEDYDLVYVENNSLVPEHPLARGITILPPFLLYDENDVSKLYLDIFQNFDAVLFETFNEYTVVLTRILLANTELQIYIRDERIRWFVTMNERVHIVDKLPEKEQVNGFFCCERLCPGYAEGLHDQMSVEFLFLNVFVLQWLTDLPLEQVRYVELTPCYFTGMGGILSWMTKVQNCFQELGWQTFLQPDSTRYGSITEKYFHVDTTPEDCDDSNTIYISNLTPFGSTHFLNRYSSDFHSSILRKEFRDEMDEYYDAIIGDKKALGILIRGTDYISTGLTGTRKQATVDDLLPTIREWMEKDGYDVIFLATEDQDVLEQMIGEFGKKVRTIAQERHRVSDFKEGQTISELEEEERSGKEWEVALEDTTVNYFYALYILSRCDSFMASGQCNGWDVVNSFNQGKFKRSYRFQMGVKES